MRQHNGSTGEVTNSECIPSWWYDKIRDHHTRLLAQFIEKELVLQNCYVGDHNIAWYIGIRRAKTTPTEGETR